MEELVERRRRRTNVELPSAMIEQIEGLRREWGLRHRGAVLERLLLQIFDTDEDALPADLEAASGVHPGLEEPDEQLALILVGRGELQNVQMERADEAATEAGNQRRGGIDLPGFVQRRTSEIKRGLRQASKASPSTPTPLHLSDDELNRALVEAKEHWVHLYGTAPNAIVLENAMIWLAHDIWPNADQSEGRVFTWSAACAAMREIAPAWSDDDPSFERVMVTAGVLEDPYSSGTLTLRLPTLIRRFVQRFRRRSRGSSFQTLEHTMTLQGALKLLQLPTNLGQRLTLRQIRDAYRDMALQHHPDAGGSLDAMRRLNEAYQLLKELYREPRSQELSAPIF